MVEYYHITEQKMAVFAKEIAILIEKSTSPLCFLLNGDVGVGKSFLVRHIIQSLSKAPITVPSPTFTIYQYYDIIKFGLYHVDCYRLHHIDEWLEIAETDFNQAFYFIEWPALLQPLYPHHHVVSLTLTYDMEQEDSRHIHIAETNKSHNNPSPFEALYHVPL